MPIVEAHPDEIQPVNRTEKPDSLQPVRSQDLTVTPKIEKLPKTRFGKIKAYAPEPMTHVIPEKKNRKQLTSEEKEKSHTNIIPDPELTM